MKVVLFGATGMVGSGTLRECLLDPDVESVLVVARTPTKLQDAKLREVIHKDFTEFSPIAAELTGYDACFFCLGVTSSGLTEEQYRRVTLDFAVAAARTLVANNPAMVFIYVSGAGSGGRSMWGRIKGETEQALLAMPFKGVYMFRPAYIQPMHGVVSKTRSYRVFYAVLKPMYFLLKRIMPKYVTTTENLGRAMLALVKHGGPTQILESRDIETLGRKQIVEQPRH
jgi:uncharacterized protein YbjT (DUF2867 family)